MKEEDEHKGVYQPLESWKVTVADLAITSVVFFGVMAVVTLLLCWAETGFR